MYCIDPTSDEPIMLLNKHIGFDETDGQGIDGSLFQSELLALDAMGKRRIQVWINSPGGVVMDGYNIYNAILKSRTQVDTYCVGCAASIAGVIFQAGRTRIMADYGWLMYHMPFGGDDESLDVIADSLVTMIAGRCGRDEDFVRRMLERETYIDALEAKVIGFCDDIEMSEDYNRTRLAIAPTVKAKWEAGNLILNKAIEKSTLPKHHKENNMAELRLITNKLKLHPDASENSILASIENIMNREKQATEDLETATDKHRDELNRMKKQLDKLEEEKQERDDELDSLKKKYNRLKAELDDASEKNEEEDCKNMISGYARTGRIENKKEVIADWVATARLVGKAKCEAMIKALPLNKAAVNIQPVGQNELDESALPSNNAAAWMARTKLKVANRQKLNLNN